MWVEGDHVGCRRVMGHTGKITCGLQDLENVCRVLDFFPSGCCERSPSLGWSGLRNEGLRNHGGGEEDIRRTIVFQKQHLQSYYVHFTNSLLSFRSQAPNVAGKYNRHIIK